MWETTQALDLQRPEPESQLSPGCGGRPGTRRGDRATRGGRIWLEDAARPRRRYQGRARKRPASQPSGIRDGRYEEEGDPTEGSRTSITYYCDKCKCGCGRGSRICMPEGQRDLEEDQQDDVPFDRRLRLFWISSNSVATVRESTARA